MCLPYVCLYMFVCGSVRVSVCVLTGGRVQGGCSVQCPPKAKTSKASIFPDGTSWRYSCKPFIMWFWLNSNFHNPQIKSTNHCPPLLPFPEPSSAAHHVSPMWCSPSITYYCHDLLLHADKSGDKYSSGTKVKVSKQEVHLVFYTHIHRHTHIHICIYMYIYFNFELVFLERFDIERIRSVKLNAFTFIIYNTHASTLYIKDECI